jgi:hypothetical protein
VATLARVGDSGLVAALFLFAAPDTTRRELAGLVGQRDGSAG